MTHLEVPRIAVIGGGTGSFTLLQELKHATPHITALVNMSDDGGSSGILRDELGVLPPGDVRQCLVALSNTPEIRDLFNHRFGGEGPLAGHSLGNLILSGLEEQYEGDFAKAVKVVSSILNLTGEVLPITTDKHLLVMQDGDEVVRGEHAIGHRVINSRDARVWLEPESLIYPEAQAAISQADIVAIAPGNLYGSLLPALAVKGVAEAIQASKALKVVIANLVTKPGQTDGWHVVDYVEMFEKYLGKDTVDVVLYNNQPPSADLLKKYAAEGEYPVATDPERFKEINAHAVGDNLVADDIFKVHPSDTIIRRTLIRHAADRVSRQLIQLHPRIVSGRRA